MLTENEATRLNELKIQLRALGYTPYQIRNIIEDEFGTATTDTLNREQYERLTALLQDYLKFAHNCRLR